MPRSVYHTHGTKSEQLFHEDLVVEALHQYGQNFYYIPRTLIAKDEILGEDRLSKFKSAYSIEMYLENVDGFDGQGAFIQKFGLMMEQSATLVVARRRWDQLVGRFGKTIIPGRPCEGDLIYFPLTDGLFEIKFVTHQDPFYQIGKLFVYKLQVELFQYASERMETGIQQIDDFETLKSYDTSIIKNGVVSEIIVNNIGKAYSSANVTIGPEWTALTTYSVGDEVCVSNRRYIVTIAGTSGNSAPTAASGSVVNGSCTLLYTGTRATATAMVGSTTESQGTITYIAVTSGGNGYTSPPQVFITGDGQYATATAYIENIDNPDSYGDNNKFKEEASYIMFNENNPFGDFYESPGQTPISYTMDSNSTRLDSTTITMDTE
jgi:hypothetical protein